MERVISQEERIRRAEEIYNRRKIENKSGIRVSSNNVNSNKIKFSLFKRMGLQLAICSVIYIIFYLVKNTNYIFSEDVIAKTKELLSYDINFVNVYSDISSFIENNKDKFNILSVEQNNQIEENIQANSQAIVKENIEDKQENEIVNEVNEISESINELKNEDVNIENTVKEGGIGGAEEKEIKETSADEEDEKTQMEIDAEYVKKNYSFKVPVKGTITSRFGTREATEIVSANHQGIDIGANTGTSIYAAMEGTVTLVSSEGDYRETYRNYKWRSNDKICSL